MWRSLTLPTPKQKAVLDFIRGYVQLNGYSPTYQEIADNFGHKSISTAHEHVSHLISKGYLERVAINERRSLTPIAKEGRCPVCGHYVTENSVNG